MSGSLREKMINEFNTIAIKGIQAVVPEHIIDNLIFAEQFGEKKLKRLLKITGIRKRHVLEKESYEDITDMAIKAGELLLNKLKWNRDEIRALIYVTQSPEFETPATSMRIQKELGIGKNCTVFDINLGCSGYVAGLQVISNLLISCMDGNKGLLIVGDSAKVGRSEAGDGMLFGTGVAATAVERQKEGIGRSCFMQCSDGSRYNVLMSKPNQKIMMDGQAVFDFSIHDVVEEIKKFHHYFSLLQENIDFYILHQAQKLIIESMAENAGIPKEKLLYSLHEYGNTNSASIPLTLCANQADFVMPRLRLFLCGYGVGLSWGCAYVEVLKEAINPIFFWR